MVSASLALGGYLWQCFSFGTVNAVSCSALSKTVMKIIVIKNSKKNFLMMSQSLYGYVSFQN